jgi:hypothetical protein
VSDDLIAWVRVLPLEQDLAVCAAGALSPLIPDSWRLVTGTPSAH